MPWGPKRRRSQWDVVDQRRQTAAERGYDSEWRELSWSYRRDHPLCVHCLLQDRVRPSQCVDHIIPIACVPELRLIEDNWQALCTACHSYKTTKEPRSPWTPHVNRIVVCGLPGAGKTTWCEERGAPFFDADLLGLTGANEIRAARNQWIAEHRDSCSVIVASGVTAATIAAQLRGTVMHLTTVHRAA